jgi:hypothetical protein
MSNEPKGGSTREWKKKMADVSRKNGAMGGRPRVYTSNAERQAAYRQRVLRNPNP